jgi:hypothetical protein
MDAMINDPDKAKAERVMNAMMEMVKLDIAAPARAAGFASFGRSRCDAWKTIANCRSFASLRMTTGVIKVRSGAIRLSHCEGYEEA